MEIATIEGSGRFRAKGTAVESRHCFHREIRNSRRELTPYVRGYAFVIYQGWQKWPMKAEATVLKLFFCRHSSGCTFKIVRQYHPDGSRCVGA